MARAVGLDIGSRTIKVVELSGSAKSFKVVHAAIREIPPTQPAHEEGGPPREPEELASEIVKELFHDLKLPKEDVCATFAAGDTVFREITIPFTDDDQIRKVVKFEAENHLHSYSLEEVVVNWIKTSQSRDGSRLTVFASPKRDVARTIGMIRAAGVEPSSMDLDATAVFTAYDAAKVFEESPNVVLIDVGARSTTLILVAEGRPTTMRSFRLGAEHVVTRASRELGVSPEDVRQRVTLPEGPRPDDLLASTAALAPVDGESDKSLAQIEDEALSDQRSDFVRKLHRESIRSLATLREGVTPDRVLLSGGGSLLPGLRESLAERFGLPVERADLSKRIDWRTKGDVGDPDTVHALTVAAVGSALRILGHDPLGVELLQDELAPTNRFDVVKNALATGVTLLFLVLLMMAFTATQKRNAEQRRHTYAVSRARLLFKEAEKAYLTKVDGKTEEAAEALISQRLRSIPADHRLAPTMMGQLRSRYLTLQRNLGLRRDIPEVPSAVEAWLEVTKALNAKPREEYGSHLRIVRLDIKPRQMTIKIEVDDQAVFDKIRRQFEESEWLKLHSRTGRVVELGATKFQDGHWQSDFYFKLEDEPDG